MPSLQDPVTDLPGVGPRRAEALGGLEIRTLDDLLRHAPRTYEDRGRPLPIDEARARPAGDFVVVRGEIARRSLLRQGRRRSTLRALLKDPSGSIEALWFNAPFLLDELPVGAEMALSGRLSKDGVLLQPELARIDDDGEVPERLTGLRAIYPLAGGVTRRLLSGWIGHGLDLADGIEDPLPEDIREEAGVLPLAVAVRCAHRPRSLEEAAAGRDRLLFDELLPLELAVRRRAAARTRRKAPQASLEGGGANAFIAELPFRLSESQTAAVEDLLADLAAAHPMSRMLAGEVGTGKTVVALAAVEEARSRGLQCALLAPTDLLARQHARTARGWLGEESVELLTGSLPAAEAVAVRGRLRSGKASFVVGTHALFSEQTRFRRLGFVVIDEQHRFGVDQRAALLRQPRTPHCLVLTATPIPRTLALLAFGDCDLSQLEPRPGARGKVKTKLVPAGRRDIALRWIRERLEAGEQAFFVRPRIQGEETGAEALHDDLSRGALRGLGVTLVHGGLPADERDARLEAFRRGEVAALVATTVVEVGLDVPGASVLWVEGAERFGLATLHQLRGRIARRGQRGTCFLLPADDAPEGARERLKALVDLDDGLQLAEIDLALRGPGELVGVRQSGRLGLFSGLGPNAPTRLAELAGRVRRAAERLLEREAAAEPSERNSSGRVP